MSTLFFLCHNLFKLKHLIMFENTTLKYETNILILGLLLAGWWQVISLGLTNCPNKMWNLDPIGSFQTFYSYQWKPQVSAGFIWETTWFSDTILIPGRKLQLWLSLVSMERLSHRIAKVFFFSSSYSDYIWSTVSYLFYAYFKNMYLDLTF